MYRGEWRVKNIPDKIYLQIEEDEMIEDFHKLLHSDRGIEITWSETRINKSDIVYYRRRSKKGAFMNQKIRSVYDNCEKVAWTKVFKAGYILQKEFIKLCPDGKGIWMTVAYNHNGDYIGNSKKAYILCKKRGIIPELISKRHKTCSIGYCEKERKWYGWSHRAIYGFGIGHRVKKGDCSSERIAVGFKIKNLRDAKKVAIAMAESVS